MERAERAELHHNLFHEFLILKFLIFIAVIALSPPAFSIAADPVPFGETTDAADQWKLMAGQSDEFDGDDVDRSKWNIDTDDFGVWSWEPENVVQKSGSMHLRLIPKDHTRRAT